jgi:hypothetical protein
VTTAALSIATWVPISSIGHVCPGPRCYPGRSVFPSPVSGLGFPAGPSLPARRLKHRRACAPPAIGLHCVRHAVAAASCVGTASHDRPISMPAKSESPFAFSGRYPSKGDLYHRLNGRYATLFAPTGSCARSIALPTASLLRSPPGLCRLLSAPAGPRPFPTLSLQILPRMSGPLPRLSSKVHLLVSSLGSSAFPEFETGRLLSFIPHSDFSADSHFGAAGILLCSDLQVCSPPWPLPPPRLAP